MRTAMPFNKPGSLTQEQYLQLLAYLLERNNLVPIGAQLAPDSGGLWNTLGVAHYRAGDWNAAQAALEKSITLRKEGDAFDWFFLAMAHWQLKNQDEARKWYDKAVEWIHAVRAQDAEKPWFVYYSTGATHAPHHVASEWADRYKGQFDDGWDVYREKTLERQKKLGIVPADTELTERPEAFPAWDSLTDAERKLYARQMEVFAGFSENADWNVGRLLDSVEEMGELDNTLVIYIWDDNGASMEGTLTGSFNETTFFNGVVLEADVETGVRRAASSHLVRRRLCAHDVVGSQILLSAVLECALEHLREHARVAIGDAVEQYDLVAFREVVIADARGFGRRAPHEGDRRRRPRDARAFVQPHGRQPATSDRAARGALARAAAVRVRRQS